MYVPHHFAEHDWETLAALVRRHAFGLLVTSDEGRPEVSHVPFLLDAERRTLLGHLAAANPQAHHLEAATSALAVFQGPHAYVSPSWYESPGVPTWNYAAVHIYGRPEVIHAEDAVREIVEQLTRTYESGREQPWTPDYRDSLLRAIVGFRLHVSEVQGKLKLSQNRPAADRENVIRELAASEREGEREVARLMRERSR